MEKNNYKNALGTIFFHKQKTQGKRPPFIIIFPDWQVESTISSAGCTHRSLICRISTRETNTKTRTPRHRQRQLQSAPKTQFMLYFLKSRGFKDIRYGISTKTFHKNFPPKFVLSNIFQPNQFSKCLLIF